MEKPTGIVGHFTVDTGATDPETGFPKLRHEPMMRAEADALWDAAQAAKADRERRMPDEKAALHCMMPTRA